jgi:hypothetical protein
MRPSSSAFSKVRRGAIFASKRSCRTRAPSEPRSPASLPSSSCDRSAETTSSKTAARSSRSTTQATRSRSNCVYDAWSDDLKGNLTGVAFKNGVKGEGGMPTSFCMADHVRRELRLGTIGVIDFATR